jgi:oligopeptide transport system permease protein
MLKFIAIRLLQFPLILAIIYVVTFLLAWVAPGSPFERNERPLSPQAVKALKERFKADSALTFLTHYPFRMIQGDFGPSFKNDSLSVTDSIRQGLPVSVVLGLAAMAIAIVVGVGIGTIAAVWRGGPLDWLSLTVALIGVTLPSFVVAALLRTVFTHWFEWFPVGSPQGWDWDWRKLVLPAVALSLLPMAYVTRLTRVSMIDVLGADYVRTARAKGVSKPWVVVKHCLRNALLPVLSYVGPAAAATMVGSFVVEMVFNIPGLGRDFVESVTARDQTMILGTVMVYSVFLLSLNLLVDIAYAFVDPRIDLEAKPA